MNRISAMVAMGILLGGAAGCAGRQKAQSVPPVLVPPRIDLKLHELIGVVQFASESRGELSPLVTRKFTESARRDQGIVRILELPSETETLRSVGHAGWNSDAFRAIGQEYGVQTILAGTVTVSKVKPNVKVSATLRSGRVSALVDVTLEVQMIETATGATIWNRSASATRSIGHVSVFGGRNVVFDAEDPERAYGDLVDFLVEQVTTDFHATWERQ